MKAEVVRAEALGGSAAHPLPSLIRQVRGCLPPRCPGSGLLGPLQNQDAVALGPVASVTPHRLALSPLTVL